MKNTILGAILSISLFGTVTHALEKQTLPKSGNDPLERWVGQTEFEDHHYSMIALERASSVSDGGSQRSVQESDVFKIGKEGSNLLYLLNNYRGLQVVSFEQGVSAPEVIGEVAPTGNSPRDMYFQPSKDRLLVLENNWFEAGHWAEAQSRIVTYDVSSARKPKLSQALDIKGRVVDHRMVGDVLYVVTRVNGRGNDWYKNRKNASGYVYSYNVSSAKLKVVDVQKMSLPPSYSQGLVNIQEVKTKEGGYKYYMVAALNVSGWFWRAQETSYVEVMDISSEKGKIEPLMVAPMKGVISERSSTLIRDNSLVVTSNYNLNTRNKKARIAVEVFTLPNDESEIISSQKMDEKVEELNAHLFENETESYNKELIKKLGIQNTFTEDVVPSRRIKSVADVVMTVGDSRGQHARLQDVRVEDDLLYVFWVPRDRIDPLDVFDLSGVGEAKLSHVTHLEFEGWVEKAFPVTYKGNKYIIGLGWIEPTVNNDSGKRYPQVYVFEITKRGSRYQASQIYEKAFEVDGAAWSQLNKLDKYFEYKQTEDGVVEILFPFSAYTNNRYRSGGKLAYIDLEAVNQEKDAAIKEGSFLVGESSWLKRIFYNSPLERFNAFSDKKLYVYQEASFSNATLDIATTLELAKNTRDILPADQGTVYQVISTEEESVELREVSSSDQDARKNEALKIHSLSGVYSHSFTSGEKSYVVTTKDHYKKVTKSYKGSNGQEVFYDQNEYQNTTYNAYVVYKKEVSILKTWVSVGKRGYGHYYGRGIALGGGMGRILSAGLAGEVLGDGKTVLAEMNTGLALLDPKKDGVELYFDKNCGPSKNALSNEYKVLNGELYVIYSLALPKVERKKTYMKSVSLKSEELSCEQQAVNIPGRPMLLTPSGELVVSNSWGVNVGGRTSSGYILLKLKDEKAVLKEFLLGAGAKMTVMGDNTLIGYEPAVALNGSERGGSESFDQKFTFVSVQNESLVLEDTIVELKSYNVSLEAPTKTAQGYYAWLNGFKDQLVFISTQNQEVEVQSLKSNGEDSLESDFVRLPGYQSTVKIDSKNNRLTLLRGYYGVETYSF